ncbi:MAG: tetratricopeptide repeat protein [Thermodesulfobacteriota bacterium]|nr:tetratricopeptide repeat protein [Thermodesulfobacteriota bacterium]
MRKAYNTLSFLAILVCLAAFMGLFGACAAHRAPAPKDNTSLMERYRSGKPFFEDKDKREDQDPSARECFETGRRYQRQGRMEPAFQQYCKALAVDPEFFPARYEKARILLSRNMFKEAFTEFQAVLEQEPGFAEAHEAAGLSLFGSGLYPKAKQYFLKAAELAPDLKVPPRYLGAICNYQGEYEQAEAWCETAQELSPKDGEVHNNLGITYSMMGRHEDAVAAYKEAIALGVQGVRTYNNLALALFRLGRREQALEAFRCAGSEAAAYNNLGVACFLENDFQAAVSYFERAIELEPRFYARAHENLKRARLAGRFKESPAH